MMREGRVANVVLAHVPDTADVRRVESSNAEAIRKFMEAVNGAMRSPWVARRVNDTVVSVSVARPEVRR